MKSVTVEIKYSNGRTDKVVFGVSDSGNGLFWMSMDGTWAQLRGNEQHHVENLGGLMKTVCEIYSELGVVQMIDYSRGW